jgi:hypothetical protein
MIYFTIAFVVEKTGFNGMTIADPSSFFYG